MAKKVKLEWPLGKERRISLSMRADEPTPLHSNSWIYFPTLMGSSQVVPSGIWGWHTCGRQERRYWWHEQRYDDLDLSCLGLICGASTGATPRYMCRKLESWLLKMRQQLQLHCIFCMVAAFH